MPLTLREIMEDTPLFKDAVCVAGQNGLENEVKWTHIINDTDTIPWVRENDLLITNGQGFYQDELAQQKVINEIIQAGLAGIVISVGKYFQEIPATLISIANQSDFPIISIPWTVRFVDLTHTIHERILKEKNTLTERVFKIHDSLTNLVVEGCGLGEFAASMANILNRSITIEDTNLKILAYSLIGPTDEVRSRSIEIGYTPPEVVSYLRKLGVFERIQKDPKPQYLKPIPAMGIKFERIVAPILIGDQIYGYIWIIANGDSLTQLDFLAIERGAIVAALIMSRDMAVYEAEQRGKSNLIDHLIDPDASEITFRSEEILERLGMSGDFQIANIINIQDDVTPIRSISQILMEQIKKAGIQATLIERTKSLLVILNSAKDETTLRFVDLLTTFAKQYEQPWVIGVSSLTNSIDNFRKAFDEGVDASRMGLILGKGLASTWFYTKLGFLPWVMETPKEVIYSNYYYRIIESMDQYDSERGSEILKTLECYLSSFANAQEAAKSLFIHRNTLRQRLRKINEIWNLHLDDPLEMLNLFYAIKIFDLKNKRKRIIGK
jgi:purine catabolism regulator